MSQLILSRMVIAKKRAEVKLGESWNLRSCSKWTVRGNFKLDWATPPGEMRWHFRLIGGVSAGAMLCDLWGYILGYLCELD